MSPNRALAIIDLGLRERAGHHAAFAELVQQRTDLNQSVHVFAHAEIDPQIERNMIASGCRVSRAFAGNFYAGRNSRHSRDQIDELIRELTAAYESCLRELTVRYPSHDLKVLYPTMDGLHVVALAAAIRRCPGEPFDSLLHIVFVMFSQSSAPHSLNEFAPSLRFLHRRARIYASDREVSDELGQQLEAAAPIHPCYLSARANELSLDTSSSSVRRLMLFMGDAKVEKGFCRVPGLLRTCIGELPSQWHITVHYTNAWHNQAVQAAIAELEQYAAHDRVRIETSFWTDVELARELRDTDVFVLTHTNAAYASKSSGILWLLAARNAQILFTETTWLSREAARLGVQHRVVESEGIPQAIEAAARASGESGERLPDAAEQYRHTLFRPFWPWFDEEFSG